MQNEIKAHSSLINRVDWAHPSFGHLFAACLHNDNVAIFQEIVGEDKQKMWTMKCPFTLPSPSPNDIAFSPSFMGLNIVSYPEGCNMQAICFKDGSVNIYRPQDVFQLWSWQKESSFLLNKQANCLSWCKSRNHMVSMIIGTEDDAQIWEQDPATRQWEKKWVVSENCGTIRNVAWSPNFGRDYETVATASSVIVRIGFDVGRLHSHLRDPVHGKDDDGVSAGPWTGCRSDE